jgi:FtsP/CotA-like multicopper oxidase with cupredoxin domain
VTSYRQRLALRMFAAPRSVSVAVSAGSRAPRRISTALGVILLLSVVSGISCGDSTPTRYLPQAKLNINCIPKFAVSLPVFGPAGTVQRVDLAAHPSVTVTMMEIDQQVLPPVFSAQCNATFGKTRVWAYETADADTGTVLGPASWPAVTLVAHRGIPTQVEYVNQLPSFNPKNPGGPGLVEALLPFDQTIHWADPLGTGCGMQMRPDPMGPCFQPYYGPIPATAHLHGAEITAAYDGDPESWFTPNGLKGADYHTMGAPGPGKAIYEYPNSQEAGTLWFHDHALGITRLNVYAGLAGFYFLQDSVHEPQGYPNGAYEIEMAVQDRMFDTNGQLYFPQQQASHAHPFWSPIFEGDVATVNGAAFPYLNVEPRRYRFHILNGSDNRGFNFDFGNLPVYLVGADDNYFDAPVPVSSSSGLPVSPGERADIIVDFSNFAGQTLELSNTRMGQDYQVPDIMQFRVAAAVKTPDTSCDPANPNVSTGLCARKDPMVHLTDGKGNVLPGVKVDRVRQMIFYDYVGTPSNGAPADIKEFVNNTTWNGLESPSIAHAFPSDGVSELPRVGSIEEWDIVYLSNMAMASHPVHLHLSQFQVLNRQNIYIGSPATTPGYLAAWQSAFGSNKAVPLPSPCTAGSYCPNYGPPMDYATPNADGAIGGNPAFGPYLQGKIMPPRAGETGWKDTADAFGDSVLRILVRWTPSDVPMVPNRSYAGQNWYQFDPTQGYYVWHCHVLNHEDNEMMRPYRVVQ